MKKFRPNKWYGYIMLFIPIILYILRVFYEPDLWFLLSHGKYVLNNGFPHVEFLSMHSGLHFIMQQWLSAVIFYIIHNLFGILGIYFLIFILFLIIIYLLFKLCLIISNNRKFISSLISSFISSLLLYYYVTVRPQIFTYIILIITLIILELYLKDKKDLLFLIPILSILQINFQAAMWPVLFIFLMPFIAELLIKKDKKIKKLLIIFLLSILVGFINPYGIENMTYSFKSYGNFYINHLVSEMYSINLNEHFIHAILLLSLFFTINIIIIFRKNKKVDIHELLFIYGTFFMAIINTRNFPLFYIASLPFITKYINIKQSNNSNIPWILYIILLGFIIILLGKLIINKEYLLIDPDIKIVKYLDKYEDKDVKIFTGYNNGNLLEYYGYKTYLDTRAEIYIKEINNKEDILKEYYNVKNDPDNYFNKFDNKYKFKYYLVYRDDYKIKNKLKEKKFKIIMKTKKSTLFKRIDS